VTGEEGDQPVSAIAVIVIVLLATLLVAMLVAGARRSTTARTGVVHDDVHSFRSHAEASRRDES
jgi:hypothetical protein